jgi:NADH-quinone oxidoreductase subunit J
MGIQELLFWFFSAAMLACGILVIAQRNVVNSAMFLILLFVNMAGLVLLLEAFFLAIVQVFVYAGAVMVLFLFVIMLLDLRAAPRRLFGPLPVAAALFLVLVLTAEFWLFLRGRTPPPGGSPAQADLAGVVEPLFTRYLLPFEVTALILLVAMVGVVAVSRGGRDRP